MGPRLNIDSANCKYPLIPDQWVKILSIVLSVAGMSSSLNGTNGDNRGKKRTHADTECTGWFDHLRQYKLFVLSL